MSAWAYLSGTAGTATVPAGCVVTHIKAESRSAFATMAIFGGANVLLDGTAQLLFEIDFPLSADPQRPNELLAPQSVAGATDIVFTGTVSYFVGYVRR